MPSARSQERRGKEAVWSIRWASGSGAKRARGPAPEDTASGSRRRLGTAAASSAGPPRPPATPPPQAQPQPRLQSEFGRWTAEKSRGLAQQLNSRAEASDASTIASLQEENTRLREEIEHLKAAASASAASTARDKSASAASTARSKAASAASTDRRKLLSPAEAIIID